MSGKEEEINEYEKQIEIYQLAIDTLKSMPQFHEVYKGTSICYEPIKELERVLSNVSYRYQQVKGEQ